MTKFISYVIGLLLGAVVLLGVALWLFLAPLFQADEMLAQIRVENVIDDRCYFVSLEVLPDHDETQRQEVLARTSICGDFLGLGYEFTLPEKTFLLMKKPGIVITNLIAIERKGYNQTGNVSVGRYNLEIVEAFRGLVSNLLKKTPMVKNITYDTKTLLKKPKQGAIIMYKLEPLRQQVVVECQGCAE
ncbi:hypothetical protein U27_05257 [Candidatus Vecturithrix granuli]|uniref:Uncharacterized protein n=1 Tax=Vecturithrix granuli TaxID=1499967 RepID=A0A081C129_VECG1|nr:hypothetical protein U27_05257 [Candidatus Vecturithrix granuli]